MGDNWDASNGDEWNSGSGAHKNFGTNDMSSGNDGFGDNQGYQGDDAGAQEGNDACRICHETGHFARECTQKPASACFNCGEEGHIRSDCTAPRKFNGTCNNCGDEGHAARSCPSKPKICNNCGAENEHDTIECTANRKLDMSKIEDISIDKAWSMIAQASNERDIDDFKEAMWCLVKANPTINYTELEKELRSRGNKIHLVALEKEVLTGYTNVDLQGGIGKKYTLAFAFAPDCKRPVMMSQWPKDAADNMSRLADTGEPMPSGIPICSNCRKPGHVKKDCEEGEGEAHEATKIVCALCNEEGHRVRDCKEPRQKPREPRTCKICGEGDHIAKECPQKEERPAMLCRNCHQEGHKAAECEQPRVLRCNNCDEEGHMSKECTRPKDWSRVTCRHCGEKGHASEKKCKPGASLNGGDAGADSNTGFDSGAGGADNGWPQEAAAVSQEPASWETGASNVTVSAW